MDGKILDRGQADCKNVTALTLACHSAHAVVFDYSFDMQIIVKLMLMFLHFWNASLIY